MNDSSPTLPLNSTVELSIILPCLNEAKTLPLCLDKAKAFLRLSAVCGEIIVADNGSEDASPLLASQAGARLVKVSERGYGAALAGGIAAAQGRFVIMGDADDSYDFGSIGPILEALRRGAQLVVGNRFKGGIERGAMPFLNRYLGNPALSFIGRLFFKAPLGDFHCGLRGFETEAIAKLDLRTTGMEYASEMIVLAALRGLRIEEVPVVLHPDRRGRKPHLKPWRDGWRHLRFLLLHSPRWLYLYPGVALLIAGLLIAALLIPGPVMIADGVGLDVHTLLVGAMSILVGVQTITFGVLARAYALKGGILPPHPSRFNKFLLWLKLEHLLALSGLLLLCGFGAAFQATRLWSAASFGALDYRDAMRVLIIAVTGIVAGLQIGFSAFLLGVMDIRHR